jgi:hypothetical protein
MKTSFLRIPFFFLFIIIVFGACNKESFVETIGNVSIESANETEVGYFIFSSKSVVASCGKITLWIDGKIVGYLTADYSGTVNSCTTPPIEGKLVKIVAPVGNHQIHATVENKCRNYQVDNYYLKQGVCRPYTLN